MSAKTRWLVRLYPQAWRERYEEEFVAMLEQRSISLLDVLDMVLGALEARLHPQLGNGRTLMVKTGCAPQR